MVYPHIRLKINVSMVVTAMFFVITMWCFNSGVLNYDFAAAVLDLPLVGGVVILIVVIAVVTNYFTLAPLVAGLKKIESGGSLETKERLRSLKAMIRLPVVIIALNVAGFFLGPLGKIVPAAFRGGDAVFSTIPLLTMFYNLFIGFVCSLAIIMEHSLILSGPKRLLNFSSRDELTGRRVSDLSLRLKNVLFPFGIAVLFGAVIGVGGYSYYHRAVETSILGLSQQAAAGQALSPAQQALSPAQAAEARALSAAFSPDASPEARAAAVRTLHALAAREDAGFLLPMGTIFGVLLVISLALSIFFSSETSSFLRKFSKTLSRVLEGEGDLSQRLYLLQFNELGDLAVLYNRLIRMLQTLFLKVKSEAEATASSSASLNQFIERCSRSMREIASGAGQVDAQSVRQSETVTAVNHAVGEILASIEEVKENVSTQAGFIEQSSAALHQMSASIASVSTASREARTSSEALVALARDGEERVGQTIQSIEGIEKTSQLVAEIVSVISRIASQTNLLAMNASIEAAQAGVYGRGFAVVADEVKKLAEESAQSAVQIDQEIQAMAQSIAQGVALTRRTGEALNKISLDINQNTKRMASIALAMEEQNSGSKEILDSVGNIIQTTQQIKSRTQDQFAESNEIRGKLEVLVASTADIHSATRSQGEHMSVLQRAIDELGKVMEKNQEVVRELNQAVGKFKL